MPMVVPTAFENRYFRDPGQENTLVYISKLGKYKAHGHWDAGRLPQVQPPPLSDRRWQISPPATWTADWPTLIREHVARLVPKPEYVVMNSGIWPGDEIETDHKLRHALVDEIRRAGMKSVWKT